MRRTIDLSIERVDDCLHLELVDSGVERFDPGDHPDATGDAGIGERRPGGLGLYLVQTMVDDVSYELRTRTRQMRVSVTKRLES